MAAVDGEVFQTPMEKALDLETLDTNLFRSKELWKPPGNRGVFGGQVIGQALRAAALTVDSKFMVHSLHSYFLLAGDNTVPILYRVYRVREGRSYATRSVAARQRDKTIFVLMCSFQTHEESKLVHQHPMPSVPPPEAFKSVQQRLRDVLADPKAAKIHKSIETRLDQPFPVDVRHVTNKALGRDPLEPTQMLWIKAYGKLPDDPGFHHCVAAYSSDHELLLTSIIPHRAKLMKQGGALTMFTSLDHAIWFHAPYRADEWLLHVMESPRAINGRGFSHGRVYTQDGRLVLSTAQEGVIRYTERPQKPLAPPGVADENAKSDEPAKAKPAAKL